jgi:hypothetical protein
MGELRSHSETGDLAAATAAKLHEWKQDQASLLARFDADHDGRLSPAEWESARQAVARECEAQKLQIGHREKREQRMAWLYFALGLVCVWVCAWALRQASLGGAF